MMANEGKKGPLATTAADYAESTTLHGISYIFSGTFWLDRLIWAVVTTAAAVFAVVAAWEAYENWVNFPVLTTVSTTGYPIEKVQFPSITICAQGSVHEILGPKISSRIYSFN